MVAALATIGGLAYVRGKEAVLHGKADAASLAEAPGR